MREPVERGHVRLDPEKVAYWYLRLNGFLQMENFYVHPRGRGGARTDADLLAVRFPHRAERLFDNPDDIMQDDFETLALSAEHLDLVIAEVTRGACKLNGPWTKPDRQNIHRVLAAIGCLPHEAIDHAAESIYQTGTYEPGARFRIRLVTIGRQEDPELREAYTKVPQVTWHRALSFIYERISRYRHQKSQTDHWEPTGNILKEAVVDKGFSHGEFVDWSLAAIGVRQGVIK